MLKPTRRFVLVTLMMIQLLMMLLMTTCVARADSNSLAWWLLPNNSEDLPHQLEEDDNGFWTELWMRPFGSSSGSPTTIMEQGLGIRWIGTAPDKAGKPTHMLMVVAAKWVVDIVGETTKLGILDDEKVTWSNNSWQKLVELKRRGRRHKKGGGPKINFGKILLPQLASKNKDLSPWMLERFSDLLRKIPDFTMTPIEIRDLSVVAQLNEPSGSLLNFRYSDHCTFAEKKKIEDVLARDVEPKLTCWMEKNPEEASKFLAVLMQRPTIDCKAQLPLSANACGMATLPIIERFFATSPQITLALQKCSEDLADTVLHEIFHLAGVRETDPGFEKAFEQSESCSLSPANLSYEDTSEAFFNDLQVETRISLFRKVRDEAVEKWKWSEGQRSFVLGSICMKMGDKYCARRYFQLASDANLPGYIELPEGGLVSWASLSAFELYDSITEDMTRIHQLVKYLHKDPNGTLLRRLELGVYRHHELYVARQALETVKANRGICSGDISEHIMCDDLAQLVKTPWFRNP